MPACGTLLGCCQRSAEGVVLGHRLRDVDLATSITALRREAHGQAAHHQRACLSIRDVQLATVSHPSGRAYVNS